MNKLIPLHAGRCTAVALSFVACTVTLTAHAAPSSAALPASTGMAPITVQGTTSKVGFMFERVTFEIPASESELVHVRLFTFRDGSWNASSDRSSSTDGTRPHRGSFDLEGFIPESAKPGNYPFRIGYCSEFIKDKYGNPQSVGGCASGFVMSPVAHVRLLPRNWKRPTFSVTKKQPRTKRVMQFRSYVPALTFSVKQRGKSVIVDRWSPGVFKVRLPQKIRRGQLIKVTAKIPGYSETRQYRARY